MNKPLEAYKRLPAVDKVLCDPKCIELISVYGRETVTYAIRQSIDFYREILKNGGNYSGINEVIRKITEILSDLTDSSLRKVYNATGIIINTNLGRAPLGEDLLKESFEILKGYNNLEFDLDSGGRGSRNEHVAKMLKFLTGAEDILIVNNAAAAVMLCLSCFAKRKEVIVSRGELVEIGGSFRVPEIMASSGCKMVEVGTTNKTRISDYRNAITPKTALLFKAHKSNYIIKGFTEDVELSELAALGKEFSIPVIYDQGSGLLKEIDNPAFANEPNIKSSLSSGIDIICFSGDKLLGGPQAGIIAGKKEYIAKLKKHPMLRALRVCKTTLALLETTCKYYLNEEELLKKNMVYKLISQKKEDIKTKAESLSNILKNDEISCKVIENSVPIGGGSLPDCEFLSYAVQLTYNTNSNKQRSDYAVKMYHELMHHKTPVIGILKKGDLIFDMLTINDTEIGTVAFAIKETQIMVLSR